jgi:hypothetical protein
MVGDAERSGGVGDLGTADDHQQGDAADGSVQMSPELLALLEHDGDYYLHNRAQQERPLARCELLIVNADPSVRDYEVFEAMAELTDESVPVNSMQDAVCLRFLVSSTGDTAARVGAAGAGGPGGRAGTGRGAARGRVGQAAGGGDAASKLLGGNGGEEEDSEATGEGEVEEEDEDDVVHGRFIHVAPLPDGRVDRLGAVLAWAAANASFDHLLLIDEADAFFWLNRIFMDLHLDKVGLAHTHPWLYWGAFVHDADSNVLYPHRSGVVVSANIVEELALLRKTGGSSGSGSRSGSGSSSTGGSGGVGSSSSSLGKVCVFVRACVCLRVCACVARMLPAA